MFHRLAVNNLLAKSRLAISVHCFNLANVYCRAWFSGEFKGRFGPNAENIVAGYKDIPIEDCRSFSIIAHIDHGKSTLSDCLLKYAGNIPADAQPQFLDNLEIERERGITVKAQTATMLVTDPRNSHKYLLNLIDTPGHVDFSYEVDKSLAACQGVLLLVDASQGIQAQTISNYYKAKKFNLDIVPVITKVDLPHADIEKCSEQIVDVFGLPKDRIIVTSAKQNLGIEKVIQSIIDGIMWPHGDRTLPLRARICDSWYDTYKGAICSIQVEDGCIQKEDRVMMCHSSKSYEVMEIGLLMPFTVPTQQLHSGNVGYVALGCHERNQVFIGDTIVLDSSHSPLTSKAPKPEVLPHFKPPVSMVYASVFPEDQGSYEAMRTAFDRLLLNDSSVTVQPELSEALGMGFRCGYLGVLHMTVFQERLASEFKMPVIITAPFVPHKVVIRGTHEEIMINKPSEMPNVFNVSKVLQPMADVSIVAPHDALNVLLSEVLERHGDQKDIRYLDKNTVLLECSMPWGEIVVDFHDRVKNLSSGYASLEYRDAGWAEADVVKVDILVNGNPVEALSFMCQRTDVEKRGRFILLRLKEEISRQQFEIVLQASIGSKIVAKERLAPFRKDVLTKSGKTVGGGDQTRKTKLLEAQKRGKKKMRMVGNVEIPQEAFFAVLERDYK